MKSLKNSAFIAFIFLSTSPALANPGAWTLDEGKWQIINNISYYAASKRFDALGNKVSQPTFTKKEYNPYIEYGLFDHTTIGANLFFQEASASGDSNYGLADAEFFFRSRLYHAKPQWKNSEIVVSLQPMIKLPGLFDDSDQPTIGSDDLDVGISLFAGYSFSYFKQKTFTENEIHYRHRFGTPGDQFRINNTIGQDITRKWQVLAQSFTILSDDSVRGATFTQSPRDDFDLVKLQLSGVYHYNEQLSFQAGGFYDLYGRNTGQGKGVLFSVWTRF